MQSNSKRILSMVLVLVLVLSLVPVAAFAAEEVSVAQNTSTGAVYTDINTALTEAQAGQTVSLLADTSVNSISVWENVTLDLNGYTLTAGYVSSFGGIVDSSETNTGLLSVNENRFMIQSTNAQLPVRSQEGYRFVEVIGFNTLVTDEGATFYFQPLFEAAANELLLAGIDVTGVRIEAVVQWQKGDDTRSQGFFYGNEFTDVYFNSYKPASGKYGKMFTLTLNNAADFQGLEFVATVSSSTGVVITPVVEEEEPGTENEGNVTTDSNNQVVDQVTLENEQASAVVTTGTQLNANTSTLTLTTTEMSETGSDITLNEDEQMVSVDVHVEGIASNNTVPVIVTLNEIAPESLNQGNIALYHVENGVTVAMTRVYSLEEVDTHNEYYYDVPTGTVTVALSTFSELVVRSNSVNAWNGNADYSWYNTTDNAFTLYNADQFVAFGKIVSGALEDAEGNYVLGEADSFQGKTVTLAADINLGHYNQEVEHIYYPVGYWKHGEGANKAGETVWYTYGGAFCGTFDGNGHTIANLYQNTWLMDGNYDNGYYKAAMGLFGYVVDGTVKNLTVQNFSNDGEFAPTGVITAYAKGDCVFENISLLECHPATYNTGVAGIVGWDDGGDDESEDEATHYTFRNITIDDSNTISALWGSWDVAAAGLLGYLAPYSKATLENCHVAATIDVYNDVCGNYQYYWYRYCGMLIGTVDKTQANGKLDLSNITATNCTVNFGDRHEYYYCEFVKNSLASYTHEHQFSRVPHSELVFEGKTAIGCTHDHISAGYEDKDIDGDGVIDDDMLKEDNQAVYIPFSQLFGGYGWGVDGVDLGEYPNIEVATVTTSRPKFDVAGTAKDSYDTGATVTIGDLFQGKIGVSDIDEDNVQVFVSPIGETSTASGVYVADTADWTAGTLTLSGQGAAQIIITDYHFCIATTLDIYVGKIHEHSPTTAIVEADCTNAGSITVSCSECGEVLSYEEIPATGHQNTTTTVVSKPTATETGSKVTTCNDCGQTVNTEVIPALGYTVEFSVPNGVDPIDEIQCYSAGITLPTPTGAPSDTAHSYTFVGWTTAAVEDVAEVDILDAGSTYHATANITLHAVYQYTTTTVASTSYEEKELSEITSSDIVVITMTTSNETVYALTSVNGTSAAPTGEIVTVNGNALADEPDEELKWNIETTNGSYIIYVNGDTSKWLYCTSTNNGVRVGDNSANTFTIESSYLNHTGTGRYVGVFTTNPDWRCYTSINTNIQNQTLRFFVKTSAAGSSETLYTTLTPPCTHPSTSSTVVPSTCTVAGTETEVCDLCQETIKITALPLASHQYVGGKCSVCGAADPSLVPTYKKVTSIEDELPNGTYLIVYEGGSVAFDGSLTDLDSTPNTFPVTIADSVITGDYSDKSFTITSTGASGSYTIQSASGYFIGRDATSNGINSNTSTQYVNTIAMSNGTAQITGTGGKMLSFNTATNQLKFRYLTSDNGTITLYQLVEGSGCSHANATTTTVDPSCTVAGSTTITCPDCSHTSTTELPALGHDFYEGTCTTCGEVTSVLEYVFSDYEAGSQYAESEVHKLDSIVTVTSTQCYFTQQLRIYSSSTYNGYAIVYSTKAIYELTVNAATAKNADTLIVYGSNDGADWTIIEEVSITSTSYQDFVISFNGSSYNYIKFDVSGSNQLRIASMALNTAAE